MPFNNPAARAAFFEKLKQGGGMSPGMQMQPKPAGLNPQMLSAKPTPMSPMAANMSVPMAPRLPTMGPGPTKIPKISSAQVKPVRFGKLQSYMKG